MHDEMQRRLAAHVPVRLPASLRARVLAAAREEAPAPQPARARHAPHALRWAWAAAVVVLLLVESYVARRVDARLDDLLGARGPAVADEGERLASELGLPTGHDGPRAMLPYIARGRATRGAEGVQP